ncbi:hypothetical protein H5410_037732 [Solanum commersonii]|uniref:Uncharacterized protein n=1 Tax=Solanum commersonii TaxID=4109 RepID=A0A9J5YB18_SOLCO|nr:hypothetical protein H5410_037732 [Solanum commersonii]
MKFVKSTIHFSKCRLFVNNEEALKYDLFFMFPPNEIKLGTANGYSKTISLSHEAVVRDMEKDFKANEGYGSGDYLKREECEYYSKALRLFHGLHPILTRGTTLLSRRQANTADSPPHPNPSTRKAHKQQPKKTNCPDLFH